MANVKMMKKDLLEKLQATLTLREGKKISQQELLDKCVEFSNAHLEQFILEELQIPPLDAAKIKQILAHAVDDDVQHPEKTDDELIYGT